MYNFNTSKKILYYTSRYNQKDWGIGEGNTPFESQVCSVQNCYLTTDENLLGENQIEKFDALLFHLSGIQPNVLNTLPKRTPTQRYIFSAPGPPIGEKYNRQEKMRYLFILQNFVVTDRDDAELICNYLFNIFQISFQLDNDLQKYE